MHRVVAKKIVSSLRISIEPIIIFHESPETKFFRFPLFRQCLECENTKLRIHTLAWWMQEMERDTLNKPFSFHHIISVTSLVIVTSILKVVGN